MFGVLLCHTFVLERDNYFTSPVGQMQVAALKRYASTCIADKFLSAYKK